MTPSQHDARTNDGDATPQEQLIVLLGASNLTISFPLLLRMLPAGFDHPMKIIAAHGHGRSYGIRSRVLVRSLPGITSCDLWAELARLPSVASPVALLTDIGNDLLYGVEVDQIVEWVGECARRLRSHHAEIVMTTLPTESLNRLSRLRFLATRTLFFPASRLKWETLDETVHNLNEGLHSIARDHDATIIRPAGAWYGFDPIHIRRSARRDAWQAILGAWSGWSIESPPGMISPWSMARSLMLRPRERRLAGVSQKTRQPVVQTDDMTISLY